MSSSSDVTIVFPKSSKECACDTLQTLLAHALERHEFGFRGYGNIFALEFAAGTFDKERTILEGTPVSAADIDRDAVNRLLANERWFSISGSIRHAKVDSLVDLDLMLFPTFDDEAPACVVLRMEGDLLTDIYGSDLSFVDEAAEVFVKLCLSLAALREIEAFRIDRVGDLSEVEAFDVPALQEAIISPPSISDQRTKKRISSGLIAGIKQAFLPTAEIRAKWPDGKVLETTTGFAVLSKLVPID